MQSTIEKTIKFKELLKQMKVQFSVICLSETWLESPDHSHKKLKLSVSYDYAKAKLIALWISFFGIIV